MKCECGWRLPAIEVIARKRDEMSDYRLEIACPECGVRFYQDKADAKRTEILVS